MKTKYVCNFSNGVTITRTSDRKYTWAWAVFTKDGKLFTRYAGMKGFASDVFKADKAARNAIKRAETSGTEGLYMLVAALPW